MAKGSSYCDLKSNLIREESLELKPTMEILERIRGNSRRNKEEVFTRLYRYLLRPDLYYAAYKNLYANKGAGTKGINDDTADGFSEEKINKLIQSLQNEEYAPNPVRRAYIPKKQGSSKKRPLGVPTFTDKLVQEVLRMVLEAIYEPVFLDCSHGFRPNKSCHTALKSLKCGFNGIKWFIEGDIKGCFDNIDHHVLVSVLTKKIKDARLIKLIWKFLKAGYMENWKYHATHSGCPQGGIASPILANIYLHELDKFAHEVSENLYKARDKSYTYEYAKVGRLIGKCQKQLETAKGQAKTELLKRIKELKAERLRTPCFSQTDKVMKYVRYADDFLLGVKGSKEDCEHIKQRFSEFISRCLKMELSEEKTLITHSNQYARFLGHDVRVRRDSSVKTIGNRKKRTRSNIVELCVPFADKVMAFLFEKSAIRQLKNGKIAPATRRNLYACSDLEIISTYNAELRGICNYYRLASNYHKLCYFAYLMEYSCLKTLAGKHKTTSRKIINKHRDRGGKGKWCIPYTTAKGQKFRYFANFMDCKRESGFSDMIIDYGLRNFGTRTTFEDRLSAQICEFCGATNTPLELHHVNKVKNLKGKQPWERTMIAKKRKTLAVCISCHHKIHNP